MTTRSAFRLGMVCGAVLETACYLAGRVVGVGIFRATRMPWL